MVKNEHPTAAYPYQYIELDVPCGRCVQCLRKRQNDYSARLIREVQDCSSMFFVTLTYDNHHLPLQANFASVDSDTGECTSLGEVIYGSDFIPDIRAELVSQRSSSKARYLQKYLFEINGLPKCIDGNYYIVRYTPSLYREDVKNWLKGCRVQYQRDTGKKLEFRYAWCGEYGPRGTRPHYHLCLLNLDKDVVDWMCSRWNKGYTYTKCVPPVNPDGSNARALAAKYIAKYVSKGKFDADSVLNKDAQKGRLCNSKRFGTKDFSDAEVSYFRAYDLFGKYDIDTFACIGKDGVFTGEHLSESQISKVVEEVSKRMKYQIVLKDGNSFNMFLPKAFRIRLYYVSELREVSSIVSRVEDDFLNYYYEYDGKKFQSIRKTCINFSSCQVFGKKEVSVKSVYRASLLSRKVADYLLSQYVSLHKSEYSKFCADIGCTEGDITTFMPFKAFREANKSCLFETMEETSRNSET